jgi:phosphoribosylformylglycinamidine (FGAM) synthase PurS component
LLSNNNETVSFVALGFQKREMAADTEALRILKGLKQEGISAPVHTEKNGEIVIDFSNANKDMHELGEMAKKAYGKPAFTKWNVEKMEFRLLAANLVIPSKTGKEIS